MPCGQVQLLYRGLKLTCWHTFSCSLAPSLLPDRSWLDTSLASWASASQEAAPQLLASGNLLLGISDKSPVPRTFCSDLQELGKSCFSPTCRSPIIHLCKCHQPGFVSVACVHLTECPSRSLPNQEGFFLLSELSRATGGGCVKSLHPLLV